MKIIINIFEEIKFSEKYNTEIYYTIYLSLLNTPSIMFELFPFIFLISVKYFYLNLTEKNELGILNSNGISNLKIIYLILKLIYWETFQLGLAPLVIGLFFLSSIQLISIGFISQYLNNKIEKDSNTPLVVEKDRTNF